MKTTTPRIQLVVNTKTDKQRQRINDMMGYLRNMADQVAVVVKPEDVRELGDLLERFANLVKRSGQATKEMEIDPRAWDRSI